ncbi:Laminin subunit beta-1 isoform X2 [Oopsacas minuta]|uniref:Laminin subunit beta-1 isoform X2 n=1 Tax=Oopsacas minuta TaxID=111878 RepID=A0AAV7JMV0_9METZ|nr:Laminin subunit beta-1 isoform X2 [Oopsacas minuta]
MTFHIDECDCNEKGSVLGICDTYGGQCLCTPNYGGRSCDQCSPGLQMGNNGICEPCNCDPIKSETAACNSTGYCYCTDPLSTDETSRTCSSCNPGYTLSSAGSCVSCDCDIVGSQDQICDLVSGDCTCRVGYQGSRCDSCQSTHISSGDQCVLCPCPGIEDRNNADQCFMIEGIVSCMCSDGFTGLTCEECDAGYFAEYSDLGFLASCRECDCNGNGIEVGGKLCDGVTGECLRCTGNTGGNSCDYCVDGFYQTVDGSCQACDCDVIGSEEHLCNRYTGFCECKEGFSGEKCDQCDVNFFSSSDTCPACSACFNQVFELYSSLRGRLNLYQFLSQSGCTLLSPSLQELLNMYSRNISLIHTDINLVNQVDADLFSALTGLSTQVQQLNAEVGILLTDANQEQERAMDLQTTSETNYQNARNTLERIEDTIITYTATILRIYHVLQLVYIGITKNIEDINIIVTRESELVDLQRIWITESSDLSTELVNTAVDTLLSAQKAVELQQNTTRLISWSFSLLRILFLQAELLNSTYTVVCYYGICTLVLIGGYYSQDESFI